MVAYTNYVGMRPVPALHKPKVVSHKSITPRLSDKGRKPGVLGQPWLPRKIEVILSYETLSFFLLNKRTKQATNWEKKKCKSYM